MNPADNPKEIERTEKNGEENDENETENVGQKPDPDATMSTERNPDDNTMLDEIDTVMAGSNPLENLDVSQVGPAVYRVLSARNGNVTVHNVELSGPDCTCEDMQYNQDGREVCAHIAKCMLSHPARMKPEELAMKSLMDCQMQFAELRDQTADMAETLERERTKQLSRAADDGGSDTSGSGGASERQTSSEMPEKSKDLVDPEGPSSRNPAVDPHEAAEKLQEAYDEVVDDMQVQADRGDVWVQTGRQTPDTLPGPGNVEVFEAFLRQPDQVTYDPDAAEAGKSPGKWWKNRINPADVDEYIQEVLK